MLYHLYGFAHKTAKRLLRRNGGSQSALRFLYIYDNAQLPVEMTGTDGSFSVNETQYDQPVRFSDTALLFKGENAVAGATGTVSDSRLTGSTHKAESPSQAWRQMLQTAAVEPGWKNSGYCLTGYIREKNQWVLSSWIWTSAAACRYYASIRDEANTRRIADAFLRDQQPCGGWIVRYDFTPTQTVPTLAPNDSAYIASNALLSAYRLTGDEKYLSGAIRCADWIMDTACEDGLVLIGQNATTGEWLKKSNIVDTGFTAGLFADLWDITNRESYRLFLKKFMDIYIATFWDDREGAFFTAIDEHRRPRGGHFGRGQAWALEGLLPAYRVLGDPALKQKINRLMGYLCRHQDKSGGWSYNFSHPLMGLDCKGVAIIAKSLVRWYEVTHEEHLKTAAVKALEWCKQHTMLSGDCIGGIFSYSVEGAVVHNFYSSTAFTYASAYALEVELLLAQHSTENRA